MMNWIWLGAVVAFGVLEAATAALVSIWFVGGAAVALLASFLGAALWLQIALFLAVSVGILAAVRPLMKRSNAKTRNRIGNRGNVQNSSMPKQAPLLFGRSE